MRPARSLLVAIAIAAAVAIVSAAPSAADLPFPPDTTGILTPWQLEPEAPCAGDSLTLVVRGFNPTPCVEFLGAQRLASGAVRIGIRQFDFRLCFVGPTQFYRVPVPLGRFAAGAYRLAIEVATIHVRADSSTFTESQITPLEFMVAQDCPPRPPTALPFVRAIFTDPPNPCSERPTTLVIAGEFKDGCGQVVDAYTGGPGQVGLTIKVGVGPDTACTLALKPWRQTFDLGTLPAGANHTDITLTVIDWDPNGSRYTRTTYSGAHDFFVQPRCDVIPPPGPLPYVSNIQVGLTGPCGWGSVCPLDSILVLVQGTFPSDCFGFRNIELVPSPIVGPLPVPPIVRIIVDDGGCLGRPCVNAPVPWSAAVRLPPLSVGEYALGVELAQVSCSDHYPPGLLYKTTVPFKVAETCEPRCLLAGFTPPRGELSPCNASISPDHPTQLTLVVRPTVALAGLQGLLRLEPPVLNVTNVETVGPATGMTLEWSRTPDGASFLILALHGAPIPALPYPDWTSKPAPDAWPLLRVTFGPRIEVQSFPATATVVTTAELLGSDISGQGVPVCPPPTCRTMDPRVIQPPGWSVDPWLPYGRATICLEQECDFNGDGREDVRDLVSMIRCLNGEAGCPPDAGTRFDCDADKTFSIADVLCCARHVLARPPCPDCPRDSLTHERGVHVAFGAPVATEHGVDVPLRIDGADRLGAVKLTVGAPLARYDLAGIDGANGGQWLVLSEIRDGQVVLGLIRTSSVDFRVDPTLDLRLRLALKAGMAPGGDVSVVSGEFSGGDGAMLGVDLGAPTRPLPGPAQVSLGANRPNPATADTRFTIELPEAADVSVGICDLRGRLVTTLFTGRLPSGPREFRWDGRDSGGSAASSGVYFYRVSVAGRTLARKLILMRRN